MKEAMSILQDLESEEINNERPNNQERRITLEASGRDRKTYCSRHYKTFIQLFLWDGSMQPVL